MAEGSSTGDAESLSAWWAALVANEPPPADTRALWFGLFESADGLTFYVQGYRDFDAEDETAEWATGEPSWTPGGRYLKLPSLTETENWQVAVERVLRLVSGLRPEVSWPGELDGIAAGFDDGDAHLIWTRPS